ncbi:MAG: heme-binding protein [Firmicutes bacterium]|nr:heme-binding protein [Bacillota bacterium]
MSKYEAPKYQVIKKEDHFEVRKYEGFNTTSVNEKKLSGYSGFGLLFSYISGDNKKNEKMSMTVPVINEFNDEHMSMEFVVPSKYQDDDIPIPNHPNLVTKHYPEHYAATISFSGLSNSHHVEKEKKKLMAWIDSNHIIPNGPYRLARFNPPFSIPMLRHTEIIVKIEQPKE